MAPVHAPHRQRRRGRSRDDVVKGLADRGIGTSVHFIPVHRHPYFQALLGGGDGRFPGADLAFERIVSLPLYPGLREEEVDRICAEIADIGASRR